MTFTDMTAPAQVATRARVTAALTAYDRKMENKRGYNRYAIAYYLNAVSEASILVSQGETWERALRLVLCDRVLNVALRAIGA